MSYSSSSPAPVEAKGERSSESIKKTLSVSVPDKSSSMILTAEEPSEGTCVSEPDDEASNMALPAKATSKASVLSVPHKASSTVASAKESSKASATSSMVSSTKEKKSKDSSVSTTNSKKKSAGKISLKFRRSVKPRAGAEVIKNLKWVIFPDNKWIKVWDLVVLTALFLLVFILPYQIGVSAGVSILFSIPWLVFNIFLNSIFFVDTFIYFFRAYYTENGNLVLDLKKIRRRYLRTYFIPNFVSVLPYTLAFYIVGTMYLDSSGTNVQVETFLIYIQFLSILKLIRLTRAKTILSSSETVTTFKMKRSSQMLQLLSYVFLIVVVSHWYACIWSLTAFIETSTFGSEEMLATPNWIAFWYENNAVKGGLDPIGYDNAIDRYVLSLFWAIQTITSIGYGNIVPVTRPEYFIACFIQLCAGVMWAYVIGGLVGVAAGMQVRAEAYRARTDQANNLIHAFSDPVEIDEDDDGKEVGVNESKVVARRIRQYIHKQYTKTKGDACVNTLSSFYPAFETLTPELQREASVLVMMPYLNAVPYLSSTYMSHDAQSLVAMDSVILEFASGEIIDTDDAVEGLGRGIFIFKSGCALNLDRTLGKKTGNKIAFIRLITRGMAYGEGRVLVEDDRPAAKGKLQFLTFSQVIFIPRKAVLEALEKSDKAWKKSARWFYFINLFIVKAEQSQKENSE